MTPAAPGARGPRATNGPSSPDAVRSEVVERALDALACVYDPELRLDVVSLGLVYDVREEGDRVVVEMTLTTIGCPVSESLPSLAQQVVEEALGPDRSAEVQVVWDPPWNPSMMSDEAAGALGLRSR